MVQTEQEKTRLTERTPVTPGGEGTCPEPLQGPLTFALFFASLPTVFP